MVVSPPIEPGSVLSSGMFVLRGDGGVSHRGRYSDRDVRDCILSVLDHLRSDLLIITPGSCRAGFAQPGFVVSTSKMRSGIHAALPSLTRELGLDAAERS